MNNDRSRFVHEDWLWFISLELSNLDIECIILIRKEGKKQSADWKSSKNGFDKHYARCGKYAAIWRILEIGSNRLLGSKKNILVLDYIEETPQYLHKLKEQFLFELYIVYWWLKKRKINIVVPPWSQRFFYF